MNEYQRYICIIINKNIASEKRKSIIETVLIFVFLFNRSFFILASFSLTAFGIFELYSFIPAEQIGRTTEKIAVKHAKAKIYLFAENNNFNILLIINSPTTLPKVKIAAKLDESAKDTLFTF